MYKSRACHQFTATQTGVSENCLFLDILAPVGHAVTDRLPVLFWIYGGGFDTGSDNAVDASHLLEQSKARGTPLLFISLNYREGAYGFLGG